MSRNLFDDFLRGEEVEGSNDGDGRLDSDFGPDQLDSLSSSSDSYASDDQADAEADHVQWRTRDGTPDRVLPLCWVIHMCRRSDPFSLAFWGLNTIFWGPFTHPPTSKRFLRPNPSGQNITRGHFHV